MSDSAANWKTQEYLVLLPPTYYKMKTRSMNKTKWKKTKSLKQNLSQKTKRNYRHKMSQMSTSPW